MAIVVLLLILLLLYLLLRMVAAAGAWISGTRYRAYRQLATKYRGKYESRGLSEAPTVSFTYNGSTVRVGLAPQVAGHPQAARTRVVARFPRGLPFRLELRARLAAGAAAAPKGTRLIRLGDKEFDRGFVVQANDPEMAREFLSPTVRWSLDKLQRLAPPSGMLVSINPERLLVQVDRNLGLNAESLEYAVRETMVIHDGLQNGVAARLSQGVAIVAVGPASFEDAGLPICKVCGEPIAVPEVLCGSCRTPHHGDCWEFVGSCSIYGCNSKKCLPA